MGQRARNPGGTGVGVELVSRKEFEKRKQAVEEKSAPFYRESWGLPRHLALRSVVMRKEVFKATASSSLAKVKLLCCTAPQH